MIRPVFAAVNDGAMHPANIIPLSWYQKTVERDMCCTDCDHHWRRAVPLTMQERQLSCPVCAGEASVKFIPRAKVAH